MTLTVIIAALIGVAFVAIVANEVRKKKKGIHTCSCGGNCGACPLAGKKH